MRAIAHESNRHLALPGPGTFASSYVFSCPVQPRGLSSSPTYRVSPPVTSVSCQEHGEEFLFFFVFLHTQPIGAEGLRDGRGSCHFDGDPCSATLEARSELSAEGGAGGSPRRAHCPYCALLLRTQDGAERAQATPRNGEKRHCGPSGRPARPRVLRQGGDVTARQHCIRGRHSDGPSHAHLARHRNCQLFATLATDHQNAAAIRWRRWMRGVRTWCACSWRQV